MGRDIRRGVDENKLTWSKMEEIKLAKQTNKWKKGANIYEFCMTCFM